MKRPDMIAIFQPAQAATTDVANAILDFFLGELAGNLDSYYARIRYDSDRGRYYFLDETLQLRDRNELLQRVQRDGNCMWSCELDLGFAPAETFVAVFSDQQNQSETTLLLDIDPTVTKLIETEEEARIPFVIFVIRVAIAIGVDWLASGPNIQDWKPLTIAQLQDPRQLEWPYVIAWKPNTIDEQKVVAGLGLELKDVQRTTLGYRFISQFPET